MGVWCGPTIELDQASIEFHLLFGRFTVVITTATATGHYNGDHNGKEPGFHLGAAFS